MDFLQFSIGAYNVTSFVIGILLVLAFVYSLRKTSSSDKLNLRLLGIFCFISGVHTLKSVIGSVFFPPEGNSVSISDNYIDFVNCTFVIIFCKIFYDLFSASRVLKTLVVVLGTLSLSFFTMTILGYENITIKNYNAYAVIFMKLMFISFCIGYVILQLKKEEAFSFKYLLLCVGLLTYFSFTLLYDIVVNFLLNNALQNNSVFYFMLSVIIFEFLFACFMFYFIWNFNKFKTNY